MKDVLVHAKTRQRYRFGLGLEIARAEALLLQRQAEHDIGGASVQEEILAGLRVMAEGESNWADAHET